MSSCRATVKKGATKGDANLLKDAQADLTSLACECFFGWLVRQKVRQTTREFTAF